MKFIVRLKKIPKEIQYIIFLLLTSRIVLTFIGVISRIVLEPFHGKKYIWVYSKWLWLDIWGVWDTGWYVDIASHGYLPSLSKAPETLNQANYAFFPLYPLLMRIIGVATGSTYFAGLIVSNFSLIVACIYLFKLVKLESNNQTALKSVKYLILSPTAFIFSSVFSESLYIALLIISFYYAKKSSWFRVGLSGFFLSLTRSVGIFSVLPLLYEYFLKRDFKFQKVRLDLLFFLLFPLGLLIFSVYNYYLTGSFLAFLYIQSSWGKHFVNPLESMINGLRSSDIYTLFSAYFTLISLVALLVFYKKIGFSYWLMGMYSIFIPLSADGLSNMPRFLLVIFPLYILLAKIVKNFPQLDETFTILLALLQGFLIVFWSNKIPLIS